MISVLRGLTYALSAGGAADESAEEKAPTRIELVCEALQASA